MRSPHRNACAALRLPHLPASAPSAARRRLPAPARRSARSPPPPLPRAHPCAASAAVVEASSTFCSSSVRIGPASTTVPSTVRNNPSESAASSGAGAGCGSISPHHAPSSSHSTASGKPHNALRVAAPTATAHRRRHQHQQQSAQAGPQPQPACNHNPRRKQPRRMKQRHGG